jgi:hypothetical protein
MTTSKVFYLCLFHQALPEEAHGFFNRGNGLYSVQYFERGEWKETPELYTIESLCVNYDEDVDTVLNFVF